MLHVYVPYKSIQTQKKLPIAKLAHFTFVHTIYNNININKNSHFQNAKYYICTYPLQRHKHKHKDSLRKCVVLYLYIPSTTPRTHKKRIIDKMPSTTCVHTLDNNTNINKTSCWLKWTEACFQNSHSYMCIYALQQHKHNNKRSYLNFPVWYFTPPLQQHKHEHKGSIPKFPVFMSIYPLK